MRPRRKDMSDLKEGLVKVVKSDGAFKSEYAVQVTSYDGKHVSLFADKDDVRTSHGADYLVVHVLREPDHTDKKRLLLPSETFETSSRWVDVKESDVEEVEFK